MNEELNFEAAPFEAFEERASGLEWEHEFGRGTRARARSFAPGSFRTPAERAGAAVAKAKAPRLPPPHGMRRPGPWLAPAFVYGAPIEPYPVDSQPYPGQPVSIPSEYMRWVQSALNDVLGLQLPVHGIGDPATRSAIRSFQEQQGVPADGVVGPDTERALLAARQPVVTQSPGGRR